MTQPVYDYAPYMQHIHQQTAQRYEQAQQTAHQIAHFLHQNYHPKRVVLFGSPLFPQWPPYLQAWNEQKMSHAPTESSSLATY